MKPRRLTPQSEELADVHKLVQKEFAYMEHRIDPPSSVLRLSLEDIAEQADLGEIWVTGIPPVACAFLTRQDDALYLGKVAVEASARGRGLARCLVDVGLSRARAMGLKRLRLQSRVELTEVHQAFTAMGFVKTGDTSHPGYDRPTSITMELETCSLR